MANMHGGSMKKAMLLSIIVLGTAIIAGGIEDVRPFVDEALVSMKMREIDLSVQSMISGPFRLSLVDSCMNRPLDIPAILDTMGMRLTDPAEDPNKTLERAIALGDLEIHKPVIKSPAKEYPWKAQREIPVRLREAMDIIFAAYEQSAVEFEAAFANVDSFQMDTIRTWGLNYLARDAGARLYAERGDASIEDYDKAELEAEILTDRLFGIATKVDRQRIANASVIILKASLTAREKLEGLTAKTAISTDIPDSIASGDIIYWCETDFGLVIIGGTGRTIYKKRTALIIDLGGDDIYLNSAGGANSKTPFAVCLDLGGNDLYHSKEPFAFGSGGLGVGVLIDDAGNDIYNTGNYGIAVGAFGTGVLIDKAGDDRYQGGLFTQGAGFIGFGLLIDRAGNDSYQARMFAQGFGYVGGIGFLVDSGGDDIYVAQGAHNEKFSYAGHNISMAQGFGYGNRPDWSGGIGLLLDRVGDDAYIADIFAQGSSYWLALGGLWDGGGNDVYRGYQYCQGTATHLSAGILFDKEGDDSYSSHGVSQGFGHDNAVGYLLDLEGNDNYISHDMSRGAGNLHGVGIFIDYAGNDSYVSKRNYDTAGYGTWRKDFSGIGIKLDCHGSDNYSGMGENSSWWSPSKFRIGINFPAENKRNAE